MTRQIGLTAAVFLASVLFMGLAPVLLADDAFAIKEGDRIVFYGDSITDQRLYTTFVETYIVTRFPTMHVSFVHSGWSGDRVVGGPAVLSSTGSSATSSRTGPLSSPSCWG